MKINEMIKLIQACREANVEEISFDGLKVKFAPGDAERISSNPGDAVATLDPEELANSEAEAQDQETVQAAEAELEQLAIDDPEAFEEAVIERELDERGIEPDGDEN